jgi:hypothetical protein
VSILRSCFAEVTRLDRYRFSAALSSPSSFSACPDKSSVNAVRPEVAQPCSNGQAPLDERSGRVRKEHVPAVRSRRDPHCSIDVQPEVVVAADDPLAGVEAHADAKGEPVRPRCLGELALSLNGGADRAARRREGGEEGVAPGAHLMAAALGNGRPEDGIVAVLDVPVSLPEPFQ